MRAPLKEQKNRAVQYWDLAIIAILLSAGVNLTTTAVSEKILGLSAGLGLGLIFISLLLITSKHLRQKKFETTLKGFFIYDSKENKLCTTGEYEFGTQASNRLSAAIKEDPAIKKVWEVNPIREKSKEVDASKGTNKIRIIKKEYNKPDNLNPSLELVRELTEYLALSKLSTVVGDFFNKREIIKTKTYTREEIPEVLSKNRFLNLFSKAHEERYGFAGSRKKEKLVPEEEVVYEYTNGFIFDKFDMELPVGSTIKRNKDNSLIIDTPRAVIKMQIACEGFATTVPDSFIAGYLNLRERRRYYEYLVEIKLEIDFKISARMRSKGLEYYEWLDEYLYQIEDFFSQDRFFEKNSWGAVESTCVILFNQQRKEKT